jgi:hypothetical protein
MKRGNAAAVGEDRPQNITLAVEALANGGI